ncbi:M48 family metallopeptidase [Novosphingobium capsulatum]|uniref:M48 family metallopeptidase n=1 Tax=Novosphingobium capsulatum TaxID=13688 RepID=UPI00286B8FA4|nr:SprT family zinc-dependent metalloprotease [Novosphingobium capsulatum]
MGWRRARQPARADRLSPAVIDWLRRAAEPEAVQPAPVVTVAGRALAVEVRRLRQARRMTLRLAPDGSAARVSMPTWARTADALAFVRERADWLAAQLDRLPPPLDLAPGCALPFRGDVLTVSWDTRNPRRPVVDDGALLVGGPVEQLPARVQRWLAAEALRLCTADLAHYCARAGVAVPPLGLSSAKRRWGSCASDGTIRINWRLIMAPDAVRRSVVAHEVAHLVHFDHSPAFHALLAQLFEGSVTAANRWLKAEGRGLYRLFG